MPGVLLPCRHFEVVAPADGVLRVSVEWNPRSGAEAVMLIVAGLPNPGARVGVNPQIATHRVLAGATYGITLAYWPSHFDYLLWDTDLIGEFKLEARVER
jgi:hypothetical protein